MKQMWTERIRIIALLAVAIVSQAVGNVLLSQGMKLIAGESQLTWSNWVVIFLQAVQSPSILLGVGFYVIFFVLFAAAFPGQILGFCCRLFPPKGASTLGLPTTS